MEVIDVEEQVSFDQKAYRHYLDEMNELEEVEALLREKDAEEIEEYREPLSCDARREITILLSWGGPSDGYKIYFDKDNEAIYGCYFYADWFEYKEFKLRDEELDRVLTVYPVIPDL
jgi:hypothetical protein